MKKNVYEDEAKGLVYCSGLWLMGAPTLLFRSVPSVALTHTLHLI
jgi:hypothetical protein